METNIIQQAQYWASSEDFSEATRHEIKSLVDAGAESELVDRFYANLEFGTGGLRGILGAGTSRMNRYNVQKATWALARYLRQVHPDRKDVRVAISYDSRNFSREFAEITAGVLAACQIKAIITEQLRPVPVLSFMVRKYKCQAGVCVTASHNPPAYNGYKVYWETGGQLVSPHDLKIIEIYNSITSYHAMPYKEFAQAKSCGMVEEVLKELDDDYLARVAKLSLRSTGKKQFKIAYSALHGSGSTLVLEGLKRFGFEKPSIFTVAEQMKPDGNFPTVKSPNPEDRNALTMAVALAKAKEADIVLATDPDCDRLGLAAREHGEYVFFNGNQIGSLLIDYILGSQKANGTLKPNGLVIKTIVTTEQQRDISNYYGVACEDTLTGFKWICDLIEQYETGSRKPYRQFICGGEESYGFLADSFVRDKDAVIACCLVAEMAAYHKSQGRTLSEVLDGLFLRHGVYLEELVNVNLPGHEGAMIIQEKMKRLREEPPSVINGIHVTKALDFSIAQELVQKDGRFVKGQGIDLPRSNVLQFILEDGTRVTARPSGTEPKIKFYFSVHGAVPVGAAFESLKDIKTRLQAKLQELSTTFTRMMS